MIRPMSRSTLTLLLFALCLVSTASPPPPPFEDHYDCHLKRTNPECHCYSPKDPEWNGVLCAKDCRDRPWKEVRDEYGLTMVQLRDGCNNYCPPLIDPRVGSGCTNNTWHSLIEEFDEALIYRPEMGWPLLFLIVSVLVCPRPACRLRHSDQHIACSFARHITLTGVAS